jgi:hypothetical protein
MIAAMWPLVLWFALLTAAGLSYPRRPRTSGALWVALGVQSLVLGSLYRAGFATLGGVYWIGLGAWYLVKYRNPDVRVKHVAYWTAKA